MPTYPRLCRASWIRAEYKRRREWQRRSPRICANRAPIAAFTVDVSRPNPKSKDACKRTVRRPATLQCSHTARLCFGDGVALPFDCLEGRAGTSSRGWSRPMCSLIEKYRFCGRIARPVSTRRPAYRPAFSAGSDSGRIHGQRPPPRRPPGARIPHSTVGFTSPLPCI